MVFGYLKPDNNISQFLEVAKVSNSNENNATQHDNPTSFSILNIISNSNLSQFLDVAEVNENTYNNANATDKAWFSGVQT